MVSDLSNCIVFSHFMCLSYARLLFDLFFSAFGHNKAVIVLFDL